MEVRTFAPTDLLALSLQHAQIGMFENIREPSYGESLAKAGPSFTATVDGDPIACIGVIDQWSGYARAWALISMFAGPYMLHLTRGIRTWLKYHNPGRIDTAVDCQFPEAIRWARLLGFAQEGTMRAYTPERRDCFLYSKVR